MKFPSKLTQGEQKCIKGVHSENASRNLKCTISIHFTTERCCERCGVLEGYHTSPVVYTSARSGKSLFQFIFQQNMDIGCPGHRLSYTFNVKFSKTTQSSAFSNGNSTKMLCII